MNERGEHLLLIIKEEAEILMDLIDGYDLQYFLGNELLKRGVTMTLVNIGECVNSLSEELKQKYPDVEWSSIVKLRNIAAHNYWGLHMDWIWENATVDVPELLEKVRGILHDEGVEEGKYLFFSSFVNWFECIEN
jgi:uncharacterized protein with HEPN domain